MSWITRRLDNLGSAVTGGAGGMGLSQAPAFSHAYLQRLGGHIDEARRMLDGVRDASILPDLPEGARSEAIADLTLRLADLQAARAALTDADPWLRPLALLRHADPTIARRTLDAFTPAMPLDGASLLYTGLGVILALVVWELIKAPGALMTRRRPRPGRNY